MLRPDLIPTPEDWQALQGGRPRLYLSPTALSVEIVHVYDNDSPTTFSHSGIVVPTPYPQFQESLDKPIEIEFMNNALETPTRRVARFPATMLAMYHGVPCGERSFSMASGKVGIEGYDRLSSATKIAEFDANRRARGFQLLRLGVNPLTNGFMVTPKNA